MFNTKHFKNIFNAALVRRSCCSCLFQKCFDKWIYIAGMILCLAFVIVFSVSSVDAGMVYGKVYSSNMPLRNTRLTFTKTNGGTPIIVINVITDQSGNYNVMLPRGNYSVSYGSFSANIRSYSNPRRQNINLEGN